MHPFSRKRKQTGRVSDHFDGERFHNLLPSAHRSFSDFLRWMWNRQPGEWLPVAETKTGPPPPPRVDSLRATFVNHSTVLLQTAGMNILTDPVWSHRASPFSWLGPARVRQPGIRFEDLPPVDLVLISHSHYDHLDLPTLKRLQAAHDPLFLAGLGTAGLLHKAGIAKVRELDWWQRLELSPAVAVSGVPAQHFSQRTLRDRDKRLWLGYVVHTPAGHIYFAGDTGMGPHFTRIRERFGPMHLSLLPIGAYKPRWFMSAVHLSPHEAVLVHQQLQSEYAIAIHFGTFQLADDGQDEAIRDLARAREELGVSAERFRVLGFGEGRDIP